MANLKGSTYEKQKRDMNFKLFALGTKKSNDHLTHSEALLIKREMYFDDFASYLESQGYEDKFNLLLNEENLNDFLEERLDGLSLNSMQNYLSGFNSLLNGFKEVNITVGVSEDYFMQKMQNIKDMSLDEIKNPRGLQSDHVLQELKQIRYESYVLGNLILNHGYRINEAMNILHDPHKYISSKPDGDYIIGGVVGKGGKIYQDKTIAHQEVQLIKSIENIPSKQTFNRDLKIIDGNLRAHDFRYQYARNLFSEKMEDFGYKKALEVVSKALNHNRIEISKYYINCN